LNARRRWREAGDAPPGRAARRTWYSNVLQLPDQRNLSEKAYDKLVFNYQVPANIVAGKYRIVMTIDPGNKIPEVNEGNNKKVYGYFTIRPKLFIRTPHKSRLRQPPVPSEVTRRRTSAAAARISPPCLRRGPDGGTEGFTPEGAGGPLPHGGHSFSIRVTLL